jgi:cell division septum initiation protein DivIVA
MRTILKEEILRLNCPGYGEQSTLSVGKARSLETYKVLFVNPTSILHLFDDGSDVLRQIEAAQTDGLTSFALPSDELLNKLNDQVTVRTEQLVKFLETGGLLIYFLCRPFTLHGPNNSIDNYLWLLSLAPDQSAEKNTRNMSAVANGRNVEPTPEAQDSEFFPYLQLQGLEWNTVIRTDNLTEGYTSLAIAGPKKCIAAELYAGDNAGRIVFLPAPYSPDFDKTLLECANLWYQRKLGNEVTLEEVKKAIDEAGIAKILPETDRVHISQVEAAKEDLIVQDLASMDKSLLDKDAMVRPASRSRQNLPAAQLPSSSRVTPSGPLPKLPPGATKTAPAGVPSNGPAKPAGTPPGVPNKPGTPVAKTESGLVVPKLDQSSVKPPVPGTTPGAPAKGLTGLVPPTNKARTTLDKIPNASSSGLPKKPESLASELEALRPGAPAPVESIRPQAPPPSTSNPLPSGLKAENLLKELEQLNRGESGSASRPGEAPKASGNRALPPQIDRGTTMPTESSSAKVTMPLPGTGGQRQAMPQSLSISQEIPKPENGWPSKYAIAGLDQVGHERTQLQNQIKGLEEQIASLDERIKTIEEFKTVLLTGEGAQLVNACKKVLSAFGWSVQPSTASETELVLSLEGKPELLVRVIRSDSQTNRTDFANIIESVTSFWEEHDLEPKGVLLSCTWANTPPSERSSPDHPSGLVEHAQKKNVNLMTTAQLLGIYREHELGKLSAEEIRQKITSTSGRFDGFTIESVLSPH